jgi:hypothetical protein
MNEKAKSKCNEVYRYAELLLRERQRELKALELKHQHLVEDGSSRLALYGPFRRPKV